MLLAGRMAQFAVLGILSGSTGFAIRYYADPSDLQELVEPLEHFPRMQIDDLAYAFAPPVQVVECIKAEPPQPPRFAHAEKHVQFIRKLRLAVVAETQEERTRLMSEAQKLCSACKRSSLKKMFQRYAQSRLVAPGNDIECIDCTKKRRPLPDLEKDVFSPMVADDEGF